MIGAIALFIAAAYSVYWCNKQFNEFQDIQAKDGEWNKC